jgi:hypothetical protein
MNLDQQQQRGRALTDDQLARWREYVESNVAREIAAEHEFVMQIVAEVLGEFSAQLRAEVGKTIASKLGHAKGPKGERGDAGPIGRQVSPARRARRAIPARPASCRSPEHLCQTPCTMPGLFVPIYQASLAEIEAERQGGEAALGTA